MSHERLRPHYFFDEAKIAQLKQIAPECFEDGKINFETLRQNLGNWAQDEEDPELEHFGLFWPGKRDARKAAAIPPQGALEPVWGQGLKADGTPDTDGVNDSKNIFIEGENLEVLKLLQKSYAGKVKMIYIDPPYNTGNDFVYDDDFTEPLQEYLRRTGQVDEEGKPMTTNKRSDGRFHSKWLSMMYPRLRLARNLLREDGVIFVSIDDNEVHNLRAVMNEIFGEENYQQQITWKNKYGPGALTKGFGNLHEYILCYSKGSIESIASKLTDEEIKNYKLKDEKYSTRGGYITQPLATKSKDDRPNLVYPLIHEGIEIWPDKQWIWSKERLMKAYENDEIVIKESNGKFSVRFKQYLKDEAGNIRMGKPLSIMNGPFNQDGTKEINLIFDKPVFDFPKPVELIKYLFSMVINDADEKKGIFLDFFAGSGSSSQAIFELNNEDNGNRQMISIQIPELIEEGKIAFKEGYSRITDISKARIRKVIHKADNKYGFIVFRYNYTNFKTFSSLQTESIEYLESQLGMFNTNPLVEEVNKDGLLTEIMLLEGFTLCSSITPLEEIMSNSIRKVSSEYCDHSLLVCLDEKIASETVVALNLKGGDIFICLDSAISNVDKLRLSDKGLIKTI